MSAIDTPEWKLISNWAGLAPEELTSELFVLIMGLFQDDHPGRPQDKLETWLWKEFGEEFNKMFELLGVEQYSGSDVDVKIMKLLHAWRTDSLKAGEQLDMSQWFAGLHKEMRENTMSITRAQLREMILKEASFDPDRGTSDDELKLDLMDWSDDVTADEDSLRDAFKELTGVRPANSDLIVKIWNEDNLGEDADMYDWLLALPSRNLNVYAADSNALQRALDNSQVAAGAAELEDLEPTEYDYEMATQSGMGKRQDESVFMTVGQFRKLIREVASVKDVNDHLSDLRALGLSDNQILDGLRDYVYDKEGASEMTLWQDGEEILALPPEDELKAWLAHLGPNEAESDLQMLLMNRTAVLDKDYADRHIDNYAIGKIEQLGSKHGSRNHFIRRAIDAKNRSDRSAVDSLIADLDSELVKMSENIKLENRIDKTINKLIK